MIPECEKVGQGARLNFMLIGEYKHTLDSKKRVAVPARFRTELGHKIVITHGLDNCLWLYPLKQWQKVAEKLSGLSLGQADTRGINRFMLAGAVEVEVDTLGRVLIPDFLKEFAGLGTDVVMTGVHTRVELWDEKKWRGYKRGGGQRADSLAEKLGEVGAL